MPAFLKQRRTLLIIASFAAIALVGLTAFFVFTQTQSVNDSQSNTATETNKATESAKNGDNISNVTWQWSGSEWLASGTPPSCSSPLLTDLPVDIRLVTAILYPGQTRGGNYKPHGGFRFGSDNSITVTIPLEASLVEGSRYIEGGEVQYLFTFINSCGLAYRFDHLNTLSEKFQGLANQLPEAKVDDSRTTPFNPSVKIEKGAIVATKVGFVRTANVSLDFGVYDLREANNASKNAAFSQAHANEKQFAFYGLCWLDEFPTETSIKLKSLPGGDSVNGKTSDYCT